MLKKSIPNILTLLNLAFGLVAIIAVLQEAWFLSFVFFASALVLDFADGAAARVLNAQSEMGKQLDSLADLVSFGVLPGLVMVQLLVQYSPDWSLQTVLRDLTLEGYRPLIGLLIPMSTAWRLGRFNLDGTSSYFVGLPSPANALMIMSIPMILRSDKSPVELLSALGNPTAMLIIVVFSAFILNAPIRLFTLKFKGGSFQDKIVPILFLVAAVVLLLTMGYLGIPLVVLVYLLMSLLGMPQREEKA